MEEHEYLQKRVDKKEKTFKQKVVSFLKKGTRVPKKSDSILLSEDLPFIEDVNIKKKIGEGAFGECVKGLC